jgi:hypothetical protein
MALDSPWSTFRNYYLMFSSIELILLVGLFWGGTDTALYASFPLNTFSSAGFLSVHVSLAVLTGILAMFMVSASLKAGRMSIFTLSTTNAVFIGLAAAAGLLFYYSFSPVYSYIMALAYFGSLSSTTTALFLSI